MTEENKEEFEAFDASGKAIEAYSPEAVEQKIKEAEEKAKEGFDKDISELKSDLEKKIADKDKEIEQVKEEMSKIGSKDYNWRKVQELLKTKETEKKEIEELMNKKVKDLEEKLEGGKADRAIKQLAGGDVDLEAKIKFHYDKFAGVPATEEEFTKRMDDSYLLATGARPKNPLTPAAIRPGTGAPPAVPKEGKISDDLKDLSKKMGIKEEELKKKGLL